ncbi:nitrate reductase cytochrome c-type subunit [Uliginosibacterium sp. H1]|uniref:nitrate reductase cytochrome c-type subunit n=1 Tax=Uliginosibacterium sp. H1 TaxID=3114757 RepID=UPI002E174695|nr:nitrate reductase cytochrome c-type subunit [Uliginosibacterium sp. H1]
MKISHILAALAVVLSAALAGIVTAQPGVSTPFMDAARGVTPIPDTTRPPLLLNEENNDLRRMRAYSMQPPTIPHKVDNYRVDKNFNQCMFCHARSRAEETQAVPLSVTHYMDREGNVLGEVSPRRYFCQQCHVPQTPVKPVVTNTFEDIDSVLQAGRRNTSGK